MFQSPIEEIKNRLDIVELVGSYIKLSKTGINYRAVCPFHSEKKPSFFVSPTRQMWHCFGGCGTGGDIFKFVMQIEGVEFGDALRILAAKAGVELKKQKPEEIVWATQRNRLYEVCELATRFFEKQLEASSTGQEANKYLLGRGISQESIKKWRIGYSPDTWQGLSDFLNSQGYKKQEIEKAGLALAGDQGSFYDRFRGRIIFPIFDLNSQVVGFGGRVFKDKDKAEVAKYMNTPNTILYDKSRILYGLDRAKVDIRKQDSCILVEGYTDAIMAHQAGTTNVIATSGTALTGFQLKILKRYTENLVLGFDMDIAGENATKRGIDLAQMLGFNLKVIRLPEGKDAAEIISTNPAGWQEALKNLKSILEFYFESAFRGRDQKTPEGKKAISKILLPVLKRIPNQIEKSFWIQKLAMDLDAKEADIIEELKKVKLEEETYGLEPEEIAKLPQKSKQELLEERLLVMVIKNPKNANLVGDGQTDCLSAKAREIFSNLKKNPSFKPDVLFPETQDYFNELALKAEVEEIEEKDIEPEIKFCLKAMGVSGVKKELDDITREIKTAEVAKNQEKINELSIKFNKVSKGLNSF
ncbi:MAG: DNA primase [Candidatus Nealsonbacteria bacterium RIFCSPLOWO2_01_FULL_41_9]|uniref:DNA primase n=1 Tax=Candidatus Nealsonbacteria bacterium RIFCSPLOWO2_01_FULL_41_9 TaxID=1801671 RepID=A0A1G2ECU9_9BACT|nr:MAG: DNA primase [Candidatus Nealsonbacteria bacterium RIFCSPLOWO2_01_FULL_41_9]